MAKNINDYIPILNPGKCGSSWLAHTLTMRPYTHFPRELDFLYFLNHSLDSQWNQETVQDPIFLAIYNDPALSKEQKLLAFYEAEAAKYEPNIRLIDKAPSNLHAGFEQFRHLYQECRIIFLYRDPRDIYISNEFYQQRQLDNVARNNDVGAFEYLRNNDIFRDSFEKSSQLHRLEKLMRAEGFRLFHITYEKMKNRFQETMREVTALLDLDLQEDTLVQSNYIPEPTPLKQHLLKAESFTPLFRKGITGDWKNYIKDEEAKSWIKENHGAALIEMEYEQDLDW